MSINIGDKNKIKNSIIAENCSDKVVTDKKTVFEKHPIICGVFIAVLAGVILTFSFWEEIRIFIEGLF